jgi:hypothetical protein
MGYKTIQHDGTSAENEAAIHLGKWLVIGPRSDYRSTYCLRQARVRTFSLRKDRRMKGEANL